MSLFDSDLPHVTGKVEAVFLTPEEKWVAAVDFKMDAINGKLKLQMLVIVANLLHMLGDLKFMAHVKEN